MLNKLFDLLLHQLLGWVVSTDGQQRLRTAILTAVLALGAKMGLPPAIADWAANALLALGGVLTASYTMRQPELPTEELPAPPATADALPSFTDTKGVPVYLPPTGKP